MRIEAIDLFYVALPAIRRAADGTQDSLVVRVRADNGLAGWGECDAAPLPSIAAYVAPDSHSNIVNITEALLGEALDSPEDVRRLRAKAGAWALDIQQLEHAVSGADIALWDLLGKHLAEPVYRLLGYERSHPKTPYASVLFGDTPGETRRLAAKLRAQGYRAAKFGWGAMGKGSLEGDVALVAAAREGLGPEARLMVDAGVAWGADDEAAFRRAARFVDYGIAWLEEPLGSEEVGAYGRLGARLKAGGVPVKIAAGEGADSCRAAEDLMVNGALDFVQIDAGRIGGITSADRVCRRARELGVHYVNHTFKSHLSLAAAIHVFAGVEAFDLVEYPAGDSPLVLGMTAPGGVFRGRDGSVRAADAPGLGVEASLETIRQYLRRVRIEIDGRLLYQSPEP
jgi:L-alanine-DL-glutamate epimerase-like enolase superfamily enzyme